MAKKKSTALKKFYVASPRMSGDHGVTWAKHTLREAIEQAKTQLAEHPDREQEIVVKIVAIVKRRQTPMVVEVVK